MRSIRRYPMISQEKRLIITFRCTTDAIAMEKSWCAPPTSRTALEKLLQEQDLDPEGIYECII